MKKRYISKVEMAKDLSDKLSISLQDAKSRLSRKPKPLIEIQSIEIDGEIHELKFYLTPVKFLKL